MRLFGYELRRIPKWECYTVETSIHVCFDKDDVIVRIKPKRDYKLGEVNVVDREIDGVSLPGWVTVRISKEGDNGTED